MLNKSGFVVEVETVQVSDQTIQHNGNNCQIIHLGYFVKYSRVERTVPQISI